MEKVALEELFIEKLGYDVLNRKLEVVLKDMDDKYPILAGTIGTIDYIDSEGQLHMIWENGRTLALVPEIDEFEIVENIDKDIKVHDEVEI